MSFFLEFLMTAREMARLEALANSPWINCDVPGGMLAIDDDGLWYHAPCFVIQDIHVIEADWHEFDNFEGISRISIHEKGAIRRPESSTSPTTTSTHLSTEELFKHMDHAEDFLINNKECFIINRKIEGSVAINASEKSAKAYADTGILFKEKKRQLLFLTDDMPMWVKITSHGPAIEKILSSSHRLRML